MEHLLKQQWDISLNCVSLAKIRELDNNKFSFAVQSLSHVQLFVTPWTVARQASLPFTISQSLLKLMSIESVIFTICSVLHFDNAHLLPLPNFSNNFVILRKAI